MSSSLSKFTSKFLRACKLLKYAQETKEDTLDSLMQEFIDMHPHIDQSTIDQARLELIAEMQDPNWKDLIKQMRQSRKEQGKSGLFDYDESMKPKLKDEDFPAEEVETNESNKEIEDFYNQKPPAANQPPANKVKPAFTSQDAMSTIRSLQPQIQKLLSSLKLTPCTITFIFYSNGNIGIVSGNIKAANAIRTKFLMDLQLNFKQYLMSYYKSLPLSNVKIDLNF